MMISVFWYYKPEQISGKCAEISIGEVYMIIYFT